MIGHPTTFIALSHQLYWYDATLREAQRGRRAAQELVELKEQLIADQQLDIDDLHREIRRLNDTIIQLTNDNRALVRWISDLLRE